jgi:hypothetical protein
MVFIIFQSLKRKSQRKRRKILLSQRRKRRILLSPMRKRKSLNKMLPNLKKRRKTKKRIPIQILLNPRKKNLKRRRKNQSQKLNQMQLYKILRKFLPCLETPPLTQVNP